MTPAPKRQITIYKGKLMIRIFILVLSALTLSGCIVDGRRDHGYDHGYNHGHDNDRGHYSCPPGGCGHGPGDNDGNWRH